ncbi:hypothetical protein MATR_30980 [Marivirga tractuosa]|uniref:Uncharacterized protein n=1 Tax=Marivirga tractuosa (strain ATCC 23168 / DSM 4126 / NBRC 15989 / NCIMB 1408 / VKM B-1430 / H-43) TaxID=643867 RepID=E4TU31_MARTH|nr:hypothetical protein [Marivirga tractuosa]ADR23053.1 hypothetical protein Ftrac_3078 [Marivirga tractuosa DSM 4126]BDD16273.1 hypothetical protein MATR_30980 [Marivirga tractuosa]
MRKIILMISAVVIGLIFYSLFETENINSLEGNFKELAFERNKNNTGPVHRVYVYSIEDTLWSEMKKHADLLPHTKYGTTEVFYFLENSVSDFQLTLSIKGVNLEAHPYCIAYAVKDGQSRLKFDQDPF